MTEKKAEYNTEAQEAMLSRDEIVSRSTRYKSQVGVYFLVQDDEIVYVGQSINVPARLRQHDNSDKEFDRVFVVECSTRELDRLEMSYIDKFSPKYNKDKGTKKRKRNVKQNNPENIIKNLMKTFGKYPEMTIREFVMRHSELDSTQIFLGFCNFNSWIDRQNKKAALPQDVVRFMEAPIL